MSIRYGQKISNLADRQISAAFNGFNRAVRPKLPVLSSKTAPYTRPSDYLTIPTITSAEQKVALLVFISDDNSNFLAFTCAGNYTVDWGDGTTENFSSGATASRIYNYSTYDPTNTTLNSEGFKQAIAIITPQAGQNLTSLNFQVRHPSSSTTNFYASPIAELYISGPNLTTLTVGTSSPTSTVYPRFARYVNLINTGNVTTFASMVRGMQSMMRCDIGKTSNLLTNMNSMFFDCYALQIVTINSETNTSGVTNIFNMFYNCWSLVSVPLLDASAVTTMAGMFTNCYSLQSVPFFNTANVTSMANMFQNCYSLTNVPLFNTAKVTNMNTMFDGCYSITTIPLFNTAAVTNMSVMFRSCINLAAIPLFNTAAATDMSSMFASCFFLPAVPLFNAANVLNMSSMFQNCYSLTTVPLFNTVKVTNMSTMFDGCLSLKTVPLFNTAAVTNMGAMFRSCYSLTTVPLFNTAAVTDMSTMFNAAYSLQSVPLFNTASVINMFAMFQNCYSLTTVPLFNTANVTNMSSMFNGCVSLVSVPLFNTVKVTNMSSMFQSCYKLNTIPAFDSSALTLMSGMFNVAYNIVSLPSINVNNVTDFTNAFNSNFGLATMNFTNIRFTASFTNNKLSQSALETIFANLGTAAAGAARTITITGNWGAPTPVSLTGTTTAGSTSITMASTTGLATGMQVTGVNTPLTTNIAVTFTDAGDTVNLNNHGLSDGDEVSFAAITSTTGIVINTIYFVVNAAANSFQVAATLNGAALPLTTNGSGTLRYNSTIVSIVPNTSVTMSRPMVASGSTTLAFRQLGTYKAILKGFAVTG